MIKTHEKSEGQRIGVGSFTQLPQESQSLGPKDPKLCFKGKDESTDPLSLKLAIGL